MRNQFRAAAVAFGIGALLPLAASAVPAPVTYTGELMAENGLPYTGSVDVQVRIYSAMSGGMPLGAEDLGTVMVMGGVLDATLETLGQYTSSDQLWLEFDIDGETLSPRQRVTSVAFAHRAADADMLGGMPASAYLQGQGSVSMDSLPTNALKQVSNQALTNEFEDIAWAWEDGPTNILDFPGLPAQASVTTAETGATYLTSLTVYTQFSLTANTRLTMVLVPPSGTGVAPIMLIDDSQIIVAGVYANSWSPGNTPELAPLIGAEVQGQWVLTITDVSDDLLGTAVTGTLDTFSIQYDVVRSDEIDMKGDLNVMGDLTVGGTIHGGNVERSGATFVRWGRAECPAGMQALYTGTMMSNAHTHSGSGEALCMQGGDPGAPSNTTATSGWDLLYPARISNTIGSAGASITNSGVRCALCYTPDRGPCFEVWGSDQCPNGFAAAHTGVGFGSHYQHALRASRECIDVDFDPSQGGDGTGYLYPMAVWNNSGLNGTDYPLYRTVKCAKCCRQ